PARGLFRILVYSLSEELEADSEEEQQKREIINKANELKEKLNELEHKFEEMNIPGAISFAEEKLKEAKLILTKKMSEKEIKRMEKLKKEIVQETQKEPEVNFFKEETKNQVNQENDNIDQSQPTLDYLIGKGGYDVAVKKLYLSLNNTSQNDIQNITNEINILKNLRNRYIIQYYDIYTNNQELFIIMDYAENGTLTKFIDDNKDEKHD
ncbi:44206_t:CDS:2, partial [Gigaspora margarita]